MTTRLTSASSGGVALASALLRLLVEDQDSATRDDRQAANLARCPAVELDLQGPGWDIGLGYHESVATQWPELSRRALRLHFQTVGSPHHREILLVEQGVQDPGQLDTLACPPLVCANEPLEQARSGDRADPHRPVAGPTPRVGHRIADFIAQHIAVRTIGDDYQAIAAVEISLDIGLITVVGPGVMKNAPAAFAGQSWSETECARGHCRHHVHRQR